VQHYLSGNIWLFCDLNIDWRNLSYLNWNKWTLVKKYQIAFPRYYSSRTLFSFHLLVGENDREREKRRFGWTDPNFILRPTLLRRLLSIGLLLRNITKWRLQERTCHNKQIENFLLITLSQKTGLILFFNRKYIFAIFWFLIRKSRGKIKNNFCEYW
jgi:hypothetical protein